MPTVRLFHTDPYRRSFSARVLSCVPAGDHWAVELDQTCFYPTSGGQPNDLGTLGGQPVRDVREEEGTGRILHIVDRPLEGEVQGEIDWQRRLDHMEQHSGQHLLSGAFERLLNAATVSWHLGTETCTVDLDIGALTPEQVEAVEWECNRVIRSALPIIAHLADEESVRSMPLRKPPKVQGQIRVVEIQGYDWSPCGGTHVRNTAELGLLKIKSWEKYKQYTRVTFLAGSRALRDYFFLDRMTRDLCRSLSIAVPSLPDYIRRTQEEVSSLRRQAKVLQERLLEIEAEDLLASQSQRVGGAQVVRAVFGGRPLDELKLLAAKVAAHPASVAVFGTRGAIPQIILARSVDLPLNMGAIIREVLPLIDGRGGGSPLQAQGAGRRPEALEAALDQAILLISAALR
ncbi:MAG TPA: DHHA1 domain-containing protein [Symbiobacteriaceae bacterium]